MDGRLEMHSANATGVMPFMVMAIATAANAMSAKVIALMSYGCGGIKTRLWFFFGFGLNVERFSRYYLGAVVFDVVETVHLHLSCRQQRLHLGKYALKRFYEVSHRSAHQCVPFSAPRHHIVAI